MNNAYALFPNFINFNVKWIYVYMYIFIHLEYNDQKCGCVVANHTLQGEVKVCSFPRGLQEGGLDIYSIAVWLCAQCLDSEASDLVPNTTIHWLFLFFPLSSSLSLSLSRSLSLSFACWICTFVQMHLVKILFVIQQYFSLVYLEI